MFKKIGKVSALGCGKRFNFDVKVSDFSYFLRIVEK